MKLLLKFVILFIFSAGTISSASTCDELLRLFQAKSKQAEEMAALDLKVWGTEMAADRAKLLARIHTYQSGQIVAIAEGRIVGFINSQKISKSIQYLEEQAAWPTVTGHGFINETHDPNGTILFLLNLTVDFDAKGIVHRRSEIGSKLVKSVLDLAKRENISRVEGITRLNGFKRYLVGKGGINSVLSDSTDADRITEYLREVVKGSIRDPALSFHLVQGAEVIGPIRNAMPEDEDSKAWGALIVYHVK